MKTFNEVDVTYIVDDYNEKKLFDFNYESLFNTYFVLLKDTEEFEVQTRIEYYEVNKDVDVEHSKLMTELFELFKDDIVVSSHIDCEGDVYVIKNSQKLEEFVQKINE